MDEFFKFIGTGDNAAFVAGMILMVVGLLGPKKFFGIQMDWTPATSLTAAVIGLLIVLGSFPQLRFWRSNTVNVDKTALEQLLTKVKEGRQYANAAAGNSNDNPTCVARATASYQAIDAAITMIGDLQHPKS